MMANDSDARRSGHWRLFTGLGGHLGAGGMGGPPGGAGLGQLSPYLNVAPSYLQEVSSQALQYLSEQAPPGHGSD